MLEAVGLIPVLGKKNHAFVIILKKKKPLVVRKGKESSI